MPRGFYYIAARNRIAFATIFAVHSNERPCFSHGLLCELAGGFFLSSKTQGRDER